MKRYTTIFKESSQKSPTDIPELKVKKGNKVVVLDYFGDASGDFRLKIGKNSKENWFTYDSKDEARKVGWDL